MTATDFRQIDVAGFMAEQGVMQRSSALTTLQALAKAGWLPRPGHGRPGYFDTIALSRAVLGIGVALANRGTVRLAGDYFALRSDRDPARRLDQAVAAFLDDLMRRPDAAAQASGNKVLLIGGGGCVATWERPDLTTETFIPRDAGRASIPNFVPTAWLSGDFLAALADRAQPIEHLSEDEVSQWGRTIQDGGPAAEVAKATLADRAQKSAAARPAGASRDPEKVTPRPIRGRAS